ncbi:ZIP family metal transporter [Candidatus Woesearchaeota archaeon]|nr:ZIP family metal transporter [Candidatus Woesearchaeota archaeon]
MHAYWIILILAFLSGMTTLIGVGIALCCKRRARMIVIGIGFSAGIMLAISFFELVPEAILATGKISAIFALVLGFLALLGVHYAIPHSHICTDKGKCSRLMSIGLCVAIGMILHDFPEGFALASSYLYAPSLGILVALSIAIHNIPEAFTVALPMILVKRKWFVVKTLIIAALSEPIGAAVGLFAVSIAPSLTPMFLAFAAGAMIFVSVDELYPLAMEYKKPKEFMIGIALSLLVYFALTLLF